MLLELLKQLIIELLRVLFIEDLCRYVKNGYVRYQEQRRTLRHHALMRWIRLRHRYRLLHRLTTEPPQEL